MKNYSDNDLVQELLKRLKDKDRAYHDLMAMTKKLEALNDKLIESEKVRSNFLSNIRNEISNPITSVLTMCELISTSDEAMDAEVLKSAIDTIYKEAFSLSFQLCNIFAAAELEAGDTMLTVSKANIESLVGATAESFRKKASEKGVRIEVRTSPEITINPFFMTDPGKLQLVVSNILANAVEFSLNDKLVEVDISKDKTDLKVKIKDNGIGIAEEHLGVIFERFKQLDTGVTKGHSGHGLGLSITKSLLELLNASIDVKSVKGNGTLFTVTVPEAEAGADAQMLTVDGADFFLGDNDDFERF